MERWWATRKPMPMPSARKKKKKWNKVMMVLPTFAMSEKHSISSDLKKNKGILGWIFKMRHNEYSVSERHEPTGQVPQGRHYANILVTGDTVYISWVSYPVRRNSKKRVQAWFVCRVAALTLESPFWPPSWSPWMCIMIGDVIRCGERAVFASHQYPRLCA